MRLDQGSSVVTGHFRPAHPDFALESESTGSSCECAANAASAIFCSVVSCPYLHTVSLIPVSVKAVWIFSSFWNSSRTSDAVVTNIRSTDQARFLPFCLDARRMG